MNHRKIQNRIGIYLPILYLLFFCCIQFFFLKNMQEKTVIKVTTPLIYSGYDVVQKNHQTVGQYYYSFSKDGLQFYLLNQRTEQTLSPPLYLHGDTVPCTEEVEEVKQSLSSTVGFSKEELDQMTKDCYFVEETKLPTKIILLLILSIFLACFSIFSLLFAIIKKRRGCHIKT